MITPTNTEMTSAPKPKKRNSFGVKLESGYLESAKV